MRTSNNENDSENFCDDELQDFSFDDDTCYIVTQNDIEHCQTTPQVKLRTKCLKA